MRGGGKFVRREDGGDGGSASSRPNKSCEILILNHQIYYYSKRGTASNDVARLIMVGEVHAIRP